MDLTKKERKKRNFLIFTNHHVVGVPHEELHYNVRNLMKGIRDAYKQALEDHDRTITQGKTPRFPEGDKLPQLTDRLDIYVGDMNAVRDDHALDVRSGYRLKAAKKGDKWHVDWEPFESDESVPIHVMTARVTYDYGETMKGFSDLVQKISDKNKVAVTNPPQFALTANVKSKAYEVLKGKVKMPYTEIAASDKELISAAEKIPSDTVVIKEPTLSGGVGVHFVKKNEVREFLKDKKFDYGEGIVVQKFIPPMKTTTLRVWSSAVKGKDGNIFSEIVGVIGKEGELSNFTKGAKPFKVDMQAPSFKPVREMVKKVTETLAQATDTLPQFMCTDVGFTEEGEPVFIEAGNYSGGMSRVRNVDPYMLTRIGRSFIAGGLFTRRK